MGSTRQMAGQGLSAPQICRAHGWTAGTRLVGDEGRGPTVIRLTAVGVSLLLAVVESHNGAPERDPIESIWTLSARDWVEVTD